MKAVIFLFILLAVSACNTTDTSMQSPSKEDVHQVLNDWHKAAANADFESYFGYFASDSAIFMGTDATERWTVAVFKPWSKPYFDRGKAWNFTAKHRHVYFSNDGQTAWFDEELDTPNLGPARGTGVLSFTTAGWKISHYNLTIPIPNALVDEFVPKIDSLLKLPPNE